MGAPYIYDISRLRVKAGRWAIPSEIQKLINSVWNKDELSERKESIVVSYL